MADWDVLAFDFVLVGVIGVVGDARLSALRLLPTHALTSCAVRCEVVRS